MYLGNLQVKLPFPLTLGFKSMLQRGIQTPDMDVRWVSSLSWYFLNFFGLNGLYRIILGGDEGGSGSWHFFGPFLIYTSGQMLHRILLPALSPSLRLQSDNLRTSTNY
jgi:ER membrane protein complex subunit 3